MKSFSAKICLLCVLLFSLCPKAHCEEQVVPKAEDRNFTYQIKISPAESKSTHSIGSQELLLGIADGINPQLRMAGILIVSSPRAAQACQVKLMQEVIYATNQYGQKIKIFLRGSIGGQPLSLKLVTPSFNQLNEAPFVVEAFMDPEAYREGLFPGQFEVQLDQSLFLVQFVN